MPRNFFITGEPNAGKTTLLKDIVKELKKKGLRVGGFISPEERHHGTRTGFKVMDVESGKVAVLASLEGDGPKVSKYHVNVPSFESIALPMMKKSGNYDVMVIDEIGVMELKSRKFANMLDELLDSKTPLIATLQHGLLEKFMTEGEVIELDQENRGMVFGKLLSEAKASIVKRLEPTKAMPEKVQKQKPAKKVKPQKKRAERKPAKRAAPKKTPKVEMGEVAEQEVKPKKEKPKEQKGGLLHRIKKLLPL